MTEPFAWGERFMSIVTTVSKPKVLVVDDEPHLLLILTRELARTYDVRTAISGAVGLEILEREPDIAVVMSDMRMPGMNGTAFLAHARQRAPNAVRLLLTGRCDMREAITAINEGCIFRFLEKPCAPAVMETTLADATLQHRLIIAERQVLEETLRGAVKALCDTFALVNPSVFGMAMRVKRLASELASRVAGAELWQVEVSAMLCQLGAMTLPPGVYERRALGQGLTTAERAMLERVPQITDQLLASIPRLEPIREIVLHTRSDHRAGSAIPRGARILRVALDFDELMTVGHTAREAVARMRSSSAVYESDVLEALANLHKTVPTTVELCVDRLLEGMILASDLVATGGTLLLSRGQEVTPGTIRRIGNLDATTRQQLVTVVADADATPLRTSE